MVQDQAHVHARKMISTVCSTLVVCHLIVRLCHPCGRPCRRLVTVHVLSECPCITFSKSLELHEQMLLILFRSTGVDAHNLQLG